MEIRIRKVLMTIVSLFVIVQIFANPVTADQARQKAAQFLSSRVANKARAKMPASSDIRIASTGSDDSYYIFNIGAEDGFVIVSGEDQTEEIIGFSDSGHIDLATMPEEMKAWMQNYADEIKWLRENSTHLVKGAPRKANPTITLDENRLAYWHQHAPFDGKCPEVDGKPTIAGCVPVALAQMMYYFKKPLKTICEIPSHIDGIAPIPAGTVLEWDKMTNLPEEMSEPDQQEAVSELLIACGLAVAANYKQKTTGPATSADGHTVPYAMAKYFGYNPSMEYLDRNNYSNDEWNWLVYNELSKGRPVFYGGNRQGGAHMFLLYGYENGLYKVNWGWGKNVQNGFFRLSIADTYVPMEGYNGEFIKYNFYQGFIVGVNPSDGSSEYHARLTTTGMEKFEPIELSRSMSDDAFPTFTIEFTSSNLNPVEIPFDLGYALYDNYGVLVGDAVWARTNVAFPEHTQLNYTNTVEIKSDLPDGVYRLCPVSREHGETEVMDNYAAYYHYYLELEVQANHLFVKAHNTDDVQLNVKSFDVLEGLVQKMTLQLSLEATLENQSEIPYTGDLKLSMLDSDNNDYVLASTQITIDPGESKEVELSFVPHQEGDYNVRLLDKNNHVLAEAPVHVGHAQKLTVTNYSIENLSEDGKTHYGTTLKGKVTLMNEDTEPFEDHFFVTLFCSDVQSGSGISIAAELQANESNEYVFEFNHMEPGYYYHLEFSYSDTQQFYETPYFTCADSQDDGFSVGDVFTAKTVEGIEVTYKVLSLSPKTVAVSSQSGEMWDGAISEETTGPLTIPASVNGYTVTTIAPYAFNYSKITSVSLPTSVTSIGRAAFFYCDELETIEGLDNVTEIGEIAFRLCEQLKAITLPQTLKTIGTQAFGSCESLESITIPASVVFIDGNGLFMSCNKLNTIVVEEDNTVYDSRGDCNAIIETATNTLRFGCSTTIIPINIEVISPQAMQDFTNLKEITIPETVTEIGSSAFAFCSNLKIVTSLITQPFAINDNTFGDAWGEDEIYQNVKLYVPVGTKGLYASTDGWKKFTRIIEMDGDTHIKGDVNNDGSVNVADIVSVVNVNDGDYVAKADVDGDLMVGASDVKRIVDIMSGNDGYSDPNAVDLGLSVKWAMMNVGASCPEEYGGYYAWAETAEKSTYSWENYKYCNGTDDSLTKYCLSSAYGTVDGKREIEPMDDAARKNMGNVWRIPTKDEMDELIESCDWTVERMNGVQGYRVTGPNGNSIFMPFGGQKSDDEHYNQGGTGFYWTSNLNGSSAGLAVYMYSGNIDYMGYIRPMGLSIRPVLKRADEQDDPRLDDVVPEQIREKMRDHMPIYNGVNPPNIEGAYLIKPYTTVFCEDGNYAPGHVIDTYKIKFLNQNFGDNTIDMIDYDTQTNAYDKGNGAFISGDGTNFTAFFSTEGYTKNIYNRTALVISGSKNGNDIQDLHYGFVMVEKGSDPDHKLMDVGVFRIFKDGDSVSEPTTWEFGSNARQREHKNQSEAQTMLDGSGQ